MDKWIEVKLSDIGKTYSGLSNKSAKDFGYGKDYIPYLNIYNNSKVNINFFEKVNIKKRENQNKVKYGDIFFTTSSETPDEVGMSSVLLDEVNEVYLNSFCFGFRLNDFNTLRPEFARYYFRGMGFRKQMNYLAQGSTRYNLSKVALLKYKAILPTIPEQSKIAEILTTIDDAIEQTEKIIEKYKRMKQGLLQDLLTKGIDENGNIRSEATHEFKDSPLGRIPVEWEVSTLSNAGKIISGTTPDTDNPNYWNGEIVWITPYDLSKTPRMFIKTSERKISKKGLSACFSSIIPPYSIVISSRAPIGYFAIPTVEYVINQGCKSIILNEKIDNKFLYYQLNIIVKSMKRFGSGTTFTEISKRDLGKIKFVFPQKLEEQKNIAEILLSIDLLIEKEETYLKKLISIKQGLMQDLLTGKVRVTHLLDKGGELSGCHS